MDLHLELPRRGGGVGRALEAALREAVRSGRLAAGSPLPGTRSLAADLGLSRGTVVQVYAQLAAEGWLIGSPGSGTRVAEPPGGTVAAEETDRRPPGPRPEIDLRPGRPDLSSFPRTLWASAVRRALSAAGAEALDYGEPEGLPVLRTAIADYLSRTRGVHATADSVVITAGFAQGLALLGRALHGLGVRQAATEGPGLARHRDLLHAAGLDTAPLMVAADGADPGDLTDEAGAALLTPAHQHPRGVVLSPGRRTAFVAWARRRGGYLIEDDYDGEFRYDRQPIGAMQALGPEQVVFAGSTSKTLAPGMRIGWLVVPSSLRRPVLRAAEETGAAVPAFGQLALADLIGRGDYDRHIRRARLVYRRRRDELGQRLAALTSTRLEGVAAGLHALLPVGSAARERQLVSTGQYAGLRLHGLHTAGYWHAPSDDHPAALVLGYATPPAHAWRPALDRLAELITTLGE